MSSCSGTVSPNVAPVVASGLYDALKAHTDVDVIDTVDNLPGVDET